MCLGPPEYKEIGPRARCLGKTVGVLMCFHIVFAFLRVISYSFFAAIFDLYMCTLGFCTLRRYCRHPKRKPGMDCWLHCESQQSLLNLLAIIAFNFGLTVATFVEMMFSPPTYPPPVGIYEYDYRNLSVLQWQFGVILCVILFLFFAAELILGWMLYSSLNKEYEDMRYQSWLRQSMGVNNPSVSGFSGEFDSDVEVNHDSNTLVPPEESFPGRGFTVGSGDDDVGEPFPSYMSRAT
jgi:hypothetical protein